MKKTRSATANYKRLKPYLLAADTHGGHFTFTCAGYEPLSIENLDYTDHEGRPVYGMMHYYIQNGDLMRDPDMTFAVDDTAGTICPLTYQQDALGLYQEVFVRGANGHMRYYPGLLTELDAFLAQWSRNIIAQGFDAAQPFHDDTTDEQEG